jgi:quinol monooxygenase YgiN
MGFVCSATWTAQAGQEQAVRAALEELAPASRAEPGNLAYHVYARDEEPQVFRIFELYTDEAAFQAHVASEHFERWALGGAIPLLASREREFYLTVGD